MSYLSRSFLIFGMLAGVGCAQPELSPCVADVPLPEGSSWPERTVERTTSMENFYRKALRGVDGLTPEDLYTFVRQGALGDILVRPDDPDARAALEQRFMEAAPDPQGPLWTTLDPDGTVGRLHLGRYRAAGHPFEPMYRAATATSVALMSDRSELDWRMCRVRGLVERKEVSLSVEQWPAVVSLWHSDAPPAHSAQFKQFRNDEYVVLRKVDADPLMRAMESSVRTAASLAIP